MKHTPGPWYYTANDAEGGMVTDRRGTQVAWTLSGDPVENCANSCLIAAAPELQAALQWWLDQMQDDACDDMGKLLDAMTERARRAISKSLGV